MKKSLLGSFVGASIVLSLDSLSRVIIALYEHEDILMFSYSRYPGLVWPILLTGIATFSTFFGAMFAFTYGRDKQVLSLITFLVLIALLRYGQIKLLAASETIIYPIVALALSLVSIFLAWKLVRPKKEKEVKELPPEPISQKHHPVENDEQQSQPQ